MTEVIEDAVLATLVAAFLIREGGKASFTAKEWDEAVDHGGSVYVFRKTVEDPMQVALMQRLVEE